MKKLFKLRFIALVFGIAIALQADCQFSFSKYYYIKNKWSGKLIDVKDGSREEGAPVWQYTINYTQAQVFRLVNYDDEFFIKPRISNQFLSFRRSLAFSDNTSSSNNSDIGDLSISTGGGSTSPPYLGNISIIQDKEYVNSQASTLSALGSNKKDQQWILIAVAGESNTYFIRSAAFDYYVVLEPSGSPSGASLRLATFNGSNKQKWIIRAAAPEKIDELSLSDFKWQTHLFSGRIKGKLRWEDDSDNEDGFEIFVKRKEEDGVWSSFWSIGKTGRNKTSYEFKDGSEYGRYREHCFVVRPYNKWEMSSSNEVCAKPGEPGTTDPPPPPPGFSKIVVYNCHSEQKAVRIWTYDLTEDNSQWKDRGLLSSQWSNGGCPNNGSPLEITLTNGHSFQVKAIDCGNSSPDQTQSSCHKLTTTNAIPGKDDGGIFTLNVQ